MADLLASQRPAPMPARLSDEIGDAIAAESVRRARDRRRAVAGVPSASLPRPRAGTAPPSWDLLVPLPRDARPRA